MCLNKSHKGLVDQLVVHAVGGVNEGHSTRTVTVKDRLLKGALMFTFVAASSLVYR